MNQKEFIAKSEFDFTALSRATASEFAVPTPRGLALFPYQRAGVEFMCKAQNVLLADPPGVGKTIQAIGFMNAQRVTRALILCPASVCINWKRELERWLTDDVLSIKIYGSRQHKKSPACDILIFSYSFASRPDAINQVLRSHAYDYLVLDECHYLKERKSKRTKFVLSRKGLVGKAKNVHALSGTPIVNRPIEIFPVIDAICPQAIDGMNYFTFGLKFCGGHKTHWGWDFSGATNLKLLGAKLRRRCMIRRNKTDILKDLPEKFAPNIVYLETDANTKRLVGRMKVFDENVVLKGISADFEELSELRRELGEAKVARAAEYIRTQLSSGHEKIIVFAHHKTVIETLMKELEPFNPVQVVGGMSAAAKQDMIDKFQTDPTARIFVGSITAAGVGITLTASSYVVFVEFSWVPGENDQAVDRAHRIGQRDGVVSDYLVHEGSLDERVLKVLLSKSKTLREVLT